MRLGEFITFVQLRNNLTKSFNVLSVSENLYEVTKESEISAYRVSQLTVSNTWNEAHIVYSVNTINDKQVYRMFNCDIYFKEDTFTKKKLFIKNAKMPDLVEQILER